MSDELQDDFKYTVLVQKEVCIISFVGNIGKSAIELLNECYEELESTNCNIAILNFREVTGVEKIAYRFLVQLQLLIRKRSGSHVRACGVKSQFKAQLLEDGVIRDNELADNLKSALSIIN